MPQSIRNFFWRSGWSVGIKLAGCLQLKNKNSSSTVNNHVLVYVQTAYSSRRGRGKGERERERENLQGSMNGHKETRLPALQNSLNANFQPITDRQANWLLFQNSLIFIYLNSGYGWGSCHLAGLLRHISRDKKSLFLLFQSNLS